MSGRSTGAGAGDLVRYVPGSADGTFQLERVPVGHWILLVEHAVFVNKPGPLKGGRSGHVPEKTTVSRVLRGDLLAR